MCISLEKRSSVLCYASPLSIYPCLQFSKQGRNYRIDGRHEASLRQEKKENTKLSWAYYSFRSTQLHYPFFQFQFWQRRRLVDWLLELLLATFLALQAKDFFNPLKIYILIILLRFIFNLFIKKQIVFKTDLQEKWF